MTPLRLQMGLLSFAVLSSAVLVNVFYLQPVSGGRGLRVNVGPSPEAQAAIARPVERAVQAEQASPGSVAEPAQTVELVRAIQRELQSRGYVTGTGEGIINLVTRAAIMAYEFDHGLALTADASEDLLRTIVLGTAAADVPPVGPLKVGPHAEQVIRTAQQALSALNYGPIKVDGFMGETTVAVIRRFEQERGLAVTGRISGELVAMVAKLAALGNVQSPK
jgi:peptidoglycan hydrolase-like protein with peptidoglycan-binding domain